MKWLKPNLELYLLMVYMMNGFLASHLFTSTTGGELNIWRFLTSFHYDLEFVLLAGDNLTVGFLLFSRYLLMVAFAGSILSLVAINGWNGFVYLWNTKLRPQH
ncbi:hypothetical protein [Rossellomorea marisflavi]|uniref:hypothetical protein n=1 Tax=Rossellomorea marisflavi TaxID=189381 RepID=UPI003F9F2317